MSNERYDRGYEDGYFVGKAEAVDLIVKIINDYISEVDKEEIKKLLLLLKIDIDAI